MKEEFSKERSQFKQMLIDKEYKEKKQKASKK